MSAVWISKLAMRGLITLKEDKVAISINDSLHTFPQVEVSNKNLDEISRLLRRHGFRKIVEVRYIGGRNIIFRKV